MSNKPLLALVFWLITLPAYADVTANGKISTLGLGAEVALPLAESVDARLGFNTFNRDFNKSTVTQGLPTDYTGKLELSSMVVLADWHPAANAFRVSGGLLFNNNKFTLTGVPAASTINIGGIAYPVPAGAAVNGQVDFNKVAPYLGIGWGRTPGNSGWSFSSDIGIVFQGTPKSNITTTNIPDVYGTLASDVAQANADLQDALKNFNIYPVVSIGFGYTF